MREEQTCADVAREAATFLAQYKAICELRPPSPMERDAAKKARAKMLDYGIPIPECLT